MQKTFLKHIAALSIMILAVPPAFTRSANDDESVQAAYKAYIQAWKSKDLIALQQLIAEDYMAMNSENQVATKADEIAGAKADLHWDEMMVDEIHTHVLGNSAIASGLLSARGKRADGSDLTVKVRFLAVLERRNGTWQLAADQLTPAKPPQRKS